MLKKNLWGGVPRGWECLSETELPQNLWFLSHQGRQQLSNEPAASCKPSLVSFPTEGRAECIPCGILLPVCASILAIAWFLLMLIPCEVIRRNRSVIGGCRYWGNPVSALENTGGSYCKRKKPSHRVPTKQSLAFHGCNTERTIKPVDLCLKACWWKNSSPRHTDGNAETDTTA